jgi:hypothetical protein
MRQQAHSYIPYVRHSPDCNLESGKAPGQTTGCPGRARQAGRRSPQQAEALKTWGRAYWAAVHPFNLEGAYVNFMMDDEVQGRIQATYGDNYKRLASVKAKYDPENFFRVNQNILPATS